MIAYRATLDVPRELLWFATRLLLAERRRRGTPRGSRALSCSWQAVLGLRWFRDRTSPDALARDHGISRATAYCYLDEFITVLADLVPDLRQALERGLMCGVVPGEGHGWQIRPALRVGALLAARALSLVHPGVVTTIRQARLGDEPELRDIDAATWTAAVSPASPPAADMTFFGERTAPGDVLVAETGHVIAGYAALGQSVPLASHSHVLEIRGLAVHPAHQRSGVGRRLVEACIEQARSRGARKLSLRVLGGNVAARRLYESCGFIAEGILREEFFLDGRYVDDVLMACMMDPAAGPEG